MHSTSFKTYSSKSINRHTICENWEILLTISTIMLTAGHDFVWLSWSEPQFQLSVVCPKNADLQLMNDYTWWEVLTLIAPDSFLIYCARHSDWDDKKVRQTVIYDFIVCSVHCRVLNLQVCRIQGAFRVWSWLALNVRELTECNNMEADQV